MNRNCPSLIRLAATLFVSLSAVPLQAKVVQPGRVRLQNSGSKPLAGVQVSFIGSNRTTSDGKGAFSLEFPDKKPGDGIVNPKVSKSGYEWVNEPDFHSVVASGEASIELVMCPAGQLSAQREKYYGLSKTATLAALEQRLGSLEDLRKQDEAAWQRQKDSLTKQSEQQLKQVREMADQFARFNFDDAGALHRQAFELFQTGRIDSAVRLLEGANLPKQLRGRYQERSLLSGIARGNDQEIRRLMPAMIFQAELYSLRMEYEKAAPLYDTLVLLDTSDVENLATVAEFYQNNWKNYGKWESLNRRILSLATVPAWRRANAALSLGDMFNELGKLDSAGRWFGEYHRLGDSLYRADSTEEWNKQTLSISLQRLGSWNQTQGDFSKALEFFTKDLGISEELYRDNPKNESLKNGLAFSCQNLGFIYWKQGDFPKALEYYSKATHLMEELYSDNPKNESLKSDLAISYERLGGVQENAGDFTKALNAYRKAISLSEELFRRNPGISEYAAHLAWNLEGAGSSACQLEKKADGITFKQRATQLYDSLYKVEGKLERLSAAGDLYISMSLCTDSDVQKVSYGTKALERHLAVFQKDTSAYETVIECYLGLSWSHLFVRGFPKAESAARKGIELAKAHRLGIQSVFEANLAHALLFQGRFVEAEAIYRDLKDKPYPFDTTKICARVLLEHFDALEKAGIVHPDVAKVRALLGEAPATKPSAEKPLESDYERHHAINSKLDDPDL